MTTLDNEDLVGCSILRPANENGDRHRATIVSVESDRFNDLKDDPTLVQLKLRVGEEEYPDLVSYHTLMDSLSADTTEDSYWKFQTILQHHGPLSTTDPRYKGSSYNVLLAWESGEITWEPFNQVATDDPVTCALYAKEHNLLELGDWRRFKPIAKRQKTLIRIAKQAKLKSFRTAPVFMYGIQVPRSAAEAARIDKANGNTLWGDSIALELTQLTEYEA